MTDPHPPSEDASDRLDEPHIPPLADGEERLLQTVRRADGNRNEIYLVHRRPSDDEFIGDEPINFVAVIRYPDDDLGDTSVPSAWKRGPTERSIYIAIAEAFANVGVLPGSLLLSLDPDVQWFVDRINEKYGPAPSPTQTAANWAQLYVAACGEVLSAANACLEVANRAIGARNTAAQRPQHEISIRTFAEHAEKAEREFVGLYRSFDERCAAARDTAAQLLATQSDPLDAEVVLAIGVEESVLNNVATVKGLLGANYGPSPAAFVQGIDEANGLMRNPPDEGNIYRSRGPARASGIVLPDAAAPRQSDERTCPWCAETIKAAAVICRFCGREVQVQPNTTT
jgi:hypothetical protein